MIETRKLPACPHCAYWLHAFEGEVCPECGRQINWAMARTGIRESTSTTYTLKWAARGAISGVISSALCLSGLSLRHSSPALLGDCLLAAPGIVFGVLVATRLLKRERALPIRLILGTAASLLALDVGWAAFERLSRDTSSTGQFLISAVVAGAIGVLALELLMKLPDRFSHRRSLRRSLSDPLNFRRDPSRVPWDRALIGAGVGAVAAGIPALGAVLLGAQISEYVGIPDNRLYVGATLILWQSGVAAVFGYHAFGPDTSLTAAPGSCQPPPG